MRRREVLLTVCGISLGIVIIAGLLISDRKNYKDPEIPDSVAEIERLNPRDNVVEAIFDLGDEDDERSSKEKGKKKEDGKVPGITLGNAGTEDGDHQNQDVPEMPEGGIVNTPETGWTVGIY